MSPMTRPALKRGDRGPGVVALQELLNRTGRLLKPDGDFGGGTAGAVRTCRAEAGLGGEAAVDDDLWSWLEAVPEPSDFLSCRAVTYIAREEISSESYYAQRCAHPIWPKESSGITIGVGYDLRFQNDRFEADWSPHLPEADLARLRPWLGVAGSAGGAAALSDMDIPYAAAWRVFAGCTLPDFVGRTRGAFPALDALSDARRAVLVSLVFNRGPSVSSTDDSRREMRAIRAATDAGNLDAVPALLESMTRLWPNSSGLRDRRRHEAAIWRTDSVFPDLSV